MSKHQSKGKPSIKPVKASIQPGSPLRKANIKTVNVSKRQGSNAKRGK